MEYTQLGPRGPRVSTIGFGAWAIGGMNWGPTDDDESRKALHAALDRGVTFIDTADVYGFGHSEELIAGVLMERGLAGRGGSGREYVIVATKAGNDFYHASEKDDRGYGPIRQNCDKNYLIFAAEQSLRRLGVQTLDLLQLHSPDLDWLEQDEPWDALATLKRAGKIRHTGLSIQSFKETEQAHLLDQHHDLLDCIQVRYNLLERAAEDVLFSKAQHHGIGVIVRIPLLFGLLTGKFTRVSTFGEDDHRRANLSPEKLDLYIRRLEALQPLFTRYPGQTVTQVALRFCLTHPACQTAIPGAKTEAQVADNSAASDYGPLTPEDLALVSTV